MRHLSWGYRGKPKLIVSHSREMKNMKKYSSKLDIGIQLVKCSQKMFVSLLTRRLKKSQGKLVKKVKRFLSLKTVFELLLIFNLTEPLVSIIWVVELSFWSDKNIRTYIIWWQRYFIWRQVCNACIPVFLDCIYK